MTLGRWREDGKSWEWEDYNIHVVVITVGVGSASGDICEGEEREEGSIVSCVLNGVGVSTVSYPSPGRQIAATERL